MMECGWMCGSTTDGLDIPRGYMEVCGVDIESRYLVTVVKLLQLPALALRL